MAALLAGEHGTEAPGSTCHSAWIPATWDGSRGVPAQQILVNTLERIGVCGANGSPVITAFSGLAFTGMVALEFTKVFAKARCRGEIAPLICLIQGFLD